MNRLLAAWLALRGSLWFVPTLLVVGSVAAALVLIELQPMLERDLSQDWPRLFGAGAEGARGMLAAIATSMITVAGVVFSVTIVALSLAASQYSPRVLRSFMSDRPTQFVLGAFVAVFAYCLIVLRTIRGGDEGAFVPSMAVLGGVFMAFVGIGLLIYFVHHVATVIQVSSIVERVADETRRAIDRLFPACVGEPAAPDEAPQATALPTGVWTPVGARSTGYLVAVDAAQLLGLAESADTVLRVRPRVGDFVVEGTALVEVAPGPAHTEQDDWCSTLRSCFTVLGERDIHQDAAWGLQQLVDIALRALSPGIHDPSTAANCVDHIGALLRRLTGRTMPGPLRQRDGRLRLVVDAPDYAELVKTALASITHHAGSHETVHARLVAAVGIAADATDDPQRLAVLARQLDAHLARLATADLAGEVKDALERRAAALRGQLRLRAGDDAASGR